MFYKSKKQKLQEIETKKMNENVEKNEDISVNSESIFPTAHDTLKMSTQQWKEISSEEILDEINSQASRGRRYAEFFNSTISKKLVKELKARGYEVNVNASPLTIGPYFKITW